MQEVHLVWLVLVFIGVLIAPGWAAVSSLLAPPRR